MDESPRKPFWSTDTAAKIRRVGSLALLVVGGMTIGLGWYQTMDDVIHGLRAVTGGGMFIMFALYVLAADNPNGSKRLRALFGTMVVVLGLIALYIQFWLDR